MDTTMIRYGRVNGNPKNVLYTIRRDDIIYFGISRCKFDDGDRFIKQKGKLIASERAALVVEEAEGATITDLTTDASGLRGAVNRDNVMKLLQYFDNVDAVIKQKKEAGRKSKSQLIKDYAQQNELTLFELKLGHLEPGDLMGVPNANTKV